MTQLEPMKRAPHEARVDFREPHKGPVLKCGARTRAGHPCRNIAGYKTWHLGRGRCRYHGGCSRMKHGQRSTILWRTVHELVLGAIAGHTIGELMGRTRA